MRVLNYADQLVVMKLDLPKLRSCIFDMASVMILCMFSVNTMADVLLSSIETELSTLFDSYIEPLAVYQCLCNN